MMETKQKKYKAAVYRIFLPYRLFIDDEIYEFTFKQRSISLQFVTHSIQDQKALLGFPFNFLKFSERQQVRFDSRGITGFNEVKIYIFFDSLITKEQFFELCYVKKLKIYQLSGILEPVNYFISVYRAKTNEFWFRPVAQVDIFSFSIGLWPKGESKVEHDSSQVPHEIAVGNPYLKSEYWHTDLLDRLKTGWEVPFFLELIFEGEDALERSNYRLAGSNFALAFEALLRALIREHFPKIDIEKMRAKQMLDCYFSNYYRIADPKKLPLPLRKKEAQRLFSIIWGNRDKIMHGHDLDISKANALSARNAVKSLSKLWWNRPNKNTPLITEGPYCGSHPVMDPDIWAKRALRKFREKKYVDAEEAAEFALTIQPDHHLSKKILNDSVKFGVSSRIDPDDPMLKKFMESIKGTGLEKFVKPSMRESLKSECIKKEKPDD